MFSLLKIKIINRNVLVHRGSKKILYLTLVVIDNWKNVLRSKCRNSLDFEDSRYTLFRMFSNFIFEHFVPASKALTVFAIISSFVYVGIASRIIFHYPASELTVLWY